MDGLLVINKPQNMTSHDVVNKIRRCFNTKQVGHLGTLDPLATGVLVVCIGSATKLVQFLENVRKTYICEVTIGIETNTYDITGDVIKRNDIVSLDENVVDEVLNSFLGKQKQYPPLYSAIKKNGKKLYEYARANTFVEVEERDIEIYDIKRKSKIEYSNNLARFSFIVDVSKGTYIRSICHDLGVKLNLPATLSALTRTKNGSFLIEDSFTLEDIENGKYEIIPNLNAISDYPKINSIELVNKAKHGMKISFNDIKNELNSLVDKVAIISENNLIAIYIRDDNLHCYKAGRVWL